MSEIHAALVDALSELTVVEKGNTADTGKYSYTYADLADVVRLTRPALAKQGLTALTPLGDHDGQLAVQVVLVHKSGETMTFGPFPFPAGKDAQATGSAVTYHRRYALLAALGIAAADDDDDGATAAPAERQRTAQRSSAPSEKQVAYARSLAASLGDAATTVVPSIIEEETGRKAKLGDLTKAEMTKVIDALKPLAEKAEAEVQQNERTKAEKIEAGVASGEEPWT